MTPSEFLVETPQSLPGHLMMQSVFSGPPTVGLWFRAVG